VALLAAACSRPDTTPVEAPRGLVRAGTPDAVNIAAARARKSPPAVAWRPFSPEAFADAKRAHKLVLLDGAAEWCHWCHVMDETTYRDPEVGRALAERFVTVRVDVDERPDIAERYGAWGWPATILFSPDGEEIGKFRGYLPPDELRRALAEAEAAVQRGGTPAERPGLGDVHATPEALGWIAGHAIVSLDGYYDADQGGWGRRQKAPLGADAEVEIVRARHGDAAARARAIFTLEKQRALLDPVWGGVYQYSAGGTWDEPHYEKLMTFQAPNLEAYARAYAETRAPAFLADAQHIAGYVRAFLTNADGAFLVSQDADVNAHDDRAAFVDGDVYYRLGDRERRALGVPRVDDHVYGFENGLAIAAFVTLYEVSGDADALAAARRAAAVVLRALVGPDGAVRRGGQTARYLADAASLGRGLARLAEATGDASYREAAVSIAAAMRRDLEDPATGAFWDRTADPAAAGVFARRQEPLVPNVAAARFLAALARATGDAAFKDQGRRVLAAVLTPRALEERGRMVGEVILALDELGAIGWP
jgi:uncharacterized protein YyaL (SSP411 family)